MLKQKLILGYSTTIIVQFIQIAASIVVARIAGPTVLGTIAFGLAYVSMFQFVADLGIGTAHIKLVSEGEDLGKCIATFAILKLCTAGFFFIVVLCFFLFQKYVFEAKFESTTHEYVILIMLVTITIQVLLDIPKATFAGKIEQAKLYIPEFIRTFVYQILRIIIVAIGFRAVGLALGNLFSTLLVIPLIIYLFKDYPFTTFDKKLARRYIKIALPIIIIGMTTKVTAHFDKVILQFFTNSEQVGYYAAGYRIGGFVLLIATNVGALFFPLFSQAVARGDFEYIKNKVNKFERFSFLFIMPIVVLVAIYSKQIILIILGEQYLPSVIVMSTLSIAMFIRIINMPYGNILSGMGLFKLLSYINLFDLVFFVCVSVLMVNPKIFNLGATGAAITVLLSSLFSGIIVRIFAKKKCKIIDIMTGLKYSLYGTINLLIFYFSYKYIVRFQPIAFKIYFMPIYLIFTYSSFYLFKWINKEDWNGLLAIIDIKTMRKYINTEIRKK